MIRSTLLLCIFATLAITGTVKAEERRDFTIHHKDAPFEEVFQDLEDAVINQGMVIDYVGHVNEMLVRTADVVLENAGDGEKSPYLNAKFILFCSAALTHQAVRANQHNLATCPYVIFAYQTHKRPERTIVGYRNPEMGVPGPTRQVMEKVKQLLEKVVAEAVTP